MTRWEKVCVSCGFSCFVSSWLLNRDLLLSSDHDLGILTRLPENNSSDNLCVQCPDYLGSKSTFTLGQFGGHNGRALRTGDVLHLSAAKFTVKLHHTLSIHNSTIRLWI